MKLYQLNKIKEKWKSRNTSISRKELEEFFNNKNIYDNLSINSFHADLKTEDLYLLSEEDVERIALLAKLKFNGSFLLDGLPFYEKTESIVKYDINSHQSYIEKVIEHRRKPEITSIVLERKKEKKESQPSFDINLADIDFDLNNKTIISIDFEYKMKNKRFSLDTCFEFGVTVQKNKKIESHHFIIKGDEIFRGKYKQKLEKKFRFGETQFIEKNDIKEKFYEFFNIADCIILHGASAELGIFKAAEIKIPEHIKILDTQEIKLKEFKDEFHGTSLSNIMKGFNMRPKNLHNSGNDAYYTMKVFLKMKEIQDLKIKNKTTNKIKSC